MPDPGPTYSMQLLADSDTPLCMRVPRTDARRQLLVLAVCDGVNDWQLVCPNTCVGDDVFKHFITTQDRSRIAVWGDHIPIWTGRGRSGLDYLV